MESIKFNQLDDALQAMIATPKTIVNHADGEDLTVRNQVLKLYDRHKETFKDVHKGYIIVRRNYEDIITETGHESVCVLNQDMINEANTIYEVRYNFNLNGKTINVPEGCSIIFVGGRFYNGRVNLNNTTIYGDHDLDIFDNIKAGTTRWTSDGYIEWWDGKDWFNPYVTLKDAVVINVANVYKSIESINSNITTIVNEINNSILNVINNYRAVDTDIIARLEQEVKDRKTADEMLASGINTLDRKHDADYQELKHLISLADERIVKFREDLNTAIGNVIANYKDADVELRDLINDLVAKERNDRNKQLAEESQKVTETAKHLANEIRKEFGKLSINHAEVVKKVDMLNDRVNVEVKQYQDIINRQQIAIIDLQNRLDDLNDKIDDYNNRANKYLVRFKQGDGMLIAGQWVEAGGSAIPPSLPEGAHFDKSFINVQEDLIINITF